MRLRQQRPGITLLEVLAAIFIMGIGTLAILVLFPLGALNMARALKDDRTGSIAANADALAAARDLRSDANVRNLFAASPHASFASPDPNGRGYPVFVDAYGKLTPGAGNYVGGDPPGAGSPPPTAIRRVVPTYTPAIGIADLWFAFNDDITFESDGRPSPGPLSEPKRQGLYTWAYLLRRTKNADPSTTEMTIVVYSGRPVFTPSPEPLFTVAPVGAVGDTQLTLTWAAGEAPGLRRGNWIMDTTYTPKVVGGVAHGSVSGQCYRVVEATMQGTNSMNVQVEPPIVDAINQIAVLEGAVEVFERGTGR